MSLMSKKLKKFRLNQNLRSTKSIKMLNDMVAGINKANNINLRVTGGTGGARETFQGHNLTVRVPTRVGSTGGGGAFLQRATCIEDAPTGNVIQAHLYDSAGDEIETPIDVVCNISGGEIAQVDLATPGDIDIGDTFKLTVELDAGGTDFVEYTAINTSVTTVSFGLASLWNAKVEPEFARVTAQGTSSFCRLSADTPGEAFEVTGSSVGGTLEVETSTENVLLGNLDTAMPRLKNGNDIFISKSNYLIDCDIEECLDPSTGFEVETRFVCVSNFQASEECACTT